MVDFFVVPLQNRKSFSCLFNQKNEKISSSSSHCRGSKLNSHGVASASPWKTEWKHKTPRKRSFALLAVKYAFNDVRFYDHAVRSLFAAVVVGVVAVEVSTETRPFMTVVFSLKYTHVASAYVGRITAIHAHWRHVENGFLYDELRSAASALFPWQCSRRTMEVGTLSWVKCAR